MTSPRFHFLLNLKTGTWVIQFAHRQTQILGGWLRRGSDAPVRVAAYRTDSTAALTATALKLSVTTASEYLLTVEYVGLPPILVDVSSNPQAALDTPRTVTRRLELIDELFGSRPPETVAQAKALACFDSLTDWTGMSQTAATSTRSFAMCLMNRVVRRAGWSLTGRPMPIADACASSPGEEEAERQIEIGFRTALASFHREKAAGFDLEFFGTAFAKFVGSEFALRDDAGKFPEPQLQFAGVPDSAMFFCFAEAAIYFIERRWETSFWTSLLPHFVAGADLFTGWYHQGDRWDRDAYSRGALPTTRPHTQQTELADRLRHKSLPELIARFGKIAWLALHDELDGIVTGDETFRDSVAVRFQLLRRLPAVEPPLPEPEFEPADGADDRRFLSAILPNSLRRWINLVDDLTQQRKLLEDYVLLRFLQKEASHGNRRLAVAPCKGKPSVWNPGTKQCDPPVAGASLRFPVVPVDEPDTAATSSTDLELVVSTWNAKASKPVVWPIPSP